MTDISRHTPRVNPSQARGQARVRLILAIALQLFDERGIDRTTTNDIARVAKIPIGSIYHYFKNKDEIILTITDLQIQDVVVLFQEITERPDLRQLSWHDTMRLIVHSWAGHARQNDTFAFIYFLRYSHALRDATEPRWDLIRKTFLALFQKRNPAVSEAELGTYTQLTWSAVELAMSSEVLAERAIIILAEHLEKTYPVVPSVTPSEA